MLVFVGGLRQNFDKTSTKLRQSPVDENPKLSKTPLGVRAAAPNEYFAKFGLSSTGLCRSVVEVLSKFCRRPLTKTSKTYHFNHTKHVFTNTQRLARWVIRLRAHSGNPDGAEHACRHYLPLLEVVRGRWWVAKEIDLSTLFWHPYFIVPDRETEYNYTPRLQHIMISVDIRSSFTRVATH